MTLERGQWVVRDDWTCARLGYVHRQRDIDHALSTARFVFRRHNVTVDNLDPDRSLRRRGRIRYLTEAETHAT